MKRKAIIYPAILGFLYLLSYVSFRYTHIEMWKRDRHKYVIFPQDKIYIYYFYRPLTYVDGLLTGMRFHIGPHR